MHAWREGTCKTVWESSGEVADSRRRLFENTQTHQCIFHTLSDDQKYSQHEENESAIRFEKMLRPATTEAFYV